MSTFGSSRLQSVTSISSRSARSWKVSGVPHVAQKVRSAAGVEAKRDGVPCTKEKPCAGTLNHVTNGAPLARLQSVQ
jgi:hypothetical protein